MHLLGFCFHVSQIVGSEDLLCFRGFALWAPAERDVHMIGVTSSGA